MELGFEEVVNQDARDTKKVLPEASIDLVVSSPPYFNLKDYGTEEQIGYGQKKEDYLEDLEKVFEGVYNALKDSGSFWLIVDTYNREGDIKLLQFELAEIAKKVGEENQGFKLKEIITWDKNHTLPWSKDNEMRNVFEYIFVFSKKDDPKFKKDRIKEIQSVKDYWMTFPERYNPKGKTPSNIWKYTIPSQGAWSDDSIQHACPFPPKLVERIIRLTTDEGDTVFDPFAGTGTVIAQAEVMGRKGIGFELNEKYIDNYFNKVKPKIKEQFEKEQDKSKHKEFKEKIYNLRRLKHPKTVVRELLNDENNEWTEDKLSLNTIIALPRDGIPEEEHKIMYQDLIIIHENGFEEDKLREDIQEVVSTPTASKFGIQPRVILKHLDNIDEDFEKFFDNNLYLYTKGNFRDNSGDLDLETWKDLAAEDEWKEKGRNGVPPILSPISMNEKEIKKFHKQITET